MVRVRRAARAWMLVQAFLLPTSGQAAGGPPPVTGPPLPAANGRSSGAGASTPTALEGQLRRTVAAAPANFAAWCDLAELLSATHRPREAAVAFESALQVAPTSIEAARTWPRLAAARARLGAYDDALDAYERGLALGDAAPAVLANSAALLMVKGRLSAAIDRYREAVAIEEREPDRREHIQGIALGYFGLAVALDRDGRDGAAREAMGRALALDPGLGILRRAAQPGGDVLFALPGEEHYALALARLTQGRGADAAAAFRDYLGAGVMPFARQAQEHLARLLNAGGSLPAKGARPSAGAPAAAGATGDLSGTAVANRGDPEAARLRIVHQATVSAEGPLVAPLIDAAWRLEPNLLDVCLTEGPRAPPADRAVAAAALPAPSATQAPAPPRPSARGGGAPPDLRAVAPDGRSFKLSLQLRIEPSGRVGAASVRAPADLGDVIPRCIEDVLLRRFQVSRPVRRKPTQVRMDLRLAPAAPGGVYEVDHR